MYLYSDMAFLVLDTFHSMSLGVEKFRVELMTYFFNFPQLLNPSTFKLLNL